MLSQAVVVKPVANMYAQPSEDAEVVSQAIYGSTIGVLEQRSGLAAYPHCRRLYGLDAGLADARRLGTRISPMHWLDAWRKLKACSPTSTASRT